MKLILLVLASLFIAAPAWSAAAPGTSLLTDAGKLQGTMVRRATAADDGKVLTFSNVSSAYKLKPVGALTTVTWGNVTGKPALQPAMANSATLDKIGESNGLPMWSGGAWPGSGAGGDMFKATYDPTNLNASPFARANHTGTQAAGTITGLSYVAISGSYADLSNRPTYATVASTGSYGDLLNRPSFATVATSGSYTDLSNRPNFATVATSGSYNDLIGKPTLSTVAGTGSYTDLLNRPSTFTPPTASAGTIGGVRVGSGLSIDGSGILSTSVGGAPSLAKYIIQTADGALGNAQVLGSLSTGLLKNMSTTGVLSIASPGTDYAVPTSGSGMLKGNGAGGFSTASAGSDYLAPGSVATVATTGAYSDLIGRPTLANSATIDTTNASNISSGTLAAARGGAGTVSGILKADGAGLVSAATTTTDYVPPSRTINGLPLTNDIIIPTAAGGFTSKYYFCDDVIIAGSPNWNELEMTPDSTAVASHSTGVLSGTTPIEFDRYVTPAVGQTTVAGGEWDFSLWGHVAAGTGGPSGRLLVRLYRVSAAGAIIGGGPFASAYSGTFTNLVAALQSVRIFAAEQTGWDVTDRIGVIVLGERVAGNSVQLTFTHDKTTGQVSTMVSPVILKHDQMQGLNAGDYQHITAAQKTIATQAASATVSGYVTPSSQTFAGAKTFNDGMILVDTATATKYKLVITNGLLGLEAQP